MTSFPPAVVLKGSFGLSSSGKKLRTALIGFQFVVSIVLIISAMFVRQQNRFMQKVLFRLRQGSGSGCRVEWEYYA